MASKCPELILWNGTPTQLENNHLALSKFMEFDTYEMKMILTKCPKIFMQQDTDYIQGISCYFTSLPLASIHYFVRGHKIKQKGFIPTIMNI